MRVLWISQKMSEVHRKSTGTWIDSFAEALTGSGQLTLGNIAFTDLERLTEDSVKGVRQWLLPKDARISKSGNIPAKLVSIISDLLEEFKPDIVHIWGVESPSGLLAARKLISAPVLLEIQGLKSQIYNVYDADLSTREKFQTIGIKEILKLSGIWAEKNRYRAWAKFEKEIIAGCSDIVTQTAWADDIVRFHNPGCNTYICETGIPINPLLTSAGPWKFNGAPRIFMSAAYSAPFKGMHTAIRAVAILKSELPNIELRIAGAHTRAGIRADGYIKWVERLAVENGVTQNVSWLGPLDAGQIGTELANASAYLLPSFIENCSTSMQEAMAVGIPIVASFTGGLPSLAEHDISASYFAPGDFFTCAMKLRCILSDQSWAETLSHNANERANKRNDVNKIVADRVRIYQTVLKNSKQPNKILNEFVDPE